MMKKKQLFILIMFVSLLTLSAVSAAEYDADESVSINDNGLILEETNNEELILEDNANEEIALEESNEAILSEGEESLSFTDLNAAINGNEDDEIYLTNNYTFNSDSDSDFANGINITRDLTIHGNGFTLNGNNQARIFNINAEYVTIENIIFINGHSEENGGAISINGRFTDSIINSTFINNSAYDGGAIYIDGASEGNTICGEFRDNTATHCGGGIYLKDTSTANNFTAEFYNNIANAEKSGGGIFFHNTSSNDYFESIFMYNNAYYGAGIFFYYEVNYDIFNSDFRYNNAGSCGGAIFFQGRTNCNIFRGNYINNTASTGNGGAITFKGVSENSFFECDFINNTAGEYGGAVNYRESPKNITFNTNFINNTAKYGGGINFFEIFDEVIINGEFNGNKANEQGGGIASKGGKIENITFTNNSANYGGAIYLNGSGNIENCIFNDNTVEDDGGAVYLENSTNTVIDNCIFENNSATENGGAIRWENQKDGMVSNCNFTGNSAKNGGAIYESNATGCTFSNNTAEETGGAVYGGIISDCTFELNFAGNAGTENYDENITTATDCTSVIIRIIASDFETSYGFNEELPLTLKDEDGKNYDGFEVTIDLYKDEELIDTYEGLSGEGWLVDFDIGVYKATLSVKNTNIKPVNITLTVNQVKTVIDAPKITTDYLTNKYLVVTLKDSRGKGLSGFQVLIDFNGVKNYTTDSNGQVKISTKGLNSKTYPVKISYAGDNTHMDANASTNVIINKVTSKISANAVTTTYNINKNLVLTLKDGKGNALSGVKVTVKIGNNAKTYKTDKKGQVKVNVATFVPKTYTAIISFAGNANYKASSKSVKVVVKKAKAKLTAKKKTFKRKVKIKKYSVTLKTNKGKVMKKVVLTLKVKGKTIKAKTNNKGKAIFKIKNLKKKGTFTAVIKFQGNKYYKKLSKKVKIRVK